MDDSVLVEIEDDVATIILNAPEKYNAIGAIKERLLDTLVQLRDNADVKAIVITGNGKGFCAGADLKGNNQQTVSVDMRKRSMDQGSNIVKLIQNISKPIIAAVHGHAAGAGFSIALAADLVVADKEAKFNLAFSKVGLVPDFGAHYFLTKLLGTWKAKELIWGGEVISAEEGYRYGFVNKVVEKGEALTAAKEWAAKLVHGPTISLGYTKDIVFQASSSNLEHIIQLENFSQAIARETQEHKDAVRDFVARKQKN